MGIIYLIRTLSFFLAGLISIGASSPLRETAGALDAFNLPLISVVSSHGGGGSGDFDVGGGSGGGGGQEAAGGRIANRGGGDAADSTSDWGNQETLSN